MSLGSCLRQAVVPILATALVAGGTAGAASADARPGSPEATRAVGPGVYIVTLNRAPSVVYDGGLSGYPATRVGNSQRFDHSRPEVVSYERHLRAVQDRLLSRVGDPPVLYQMATAVNGFTAKLTSTQVKRLRASHRVRLVERSSTVHLDSVESPDLLGLDQVWRGQGGPAEAGKGIVVGLVDSGVWPENPSFVGLPQRTPGSSDGLAGFHGACQRGEQWSAEDCTDKVVSARYFVKGFGHANVAQADFLSPRDVDGHGSHTASVAAGNDKVPVEVRGQDFGSASGMAPAARIAIYKACWAAPDPDHDGCTTPDTVAAVDRAVADGVDVLGYPVSGPAGAVADSVELAFLNAATGGVFVAASAGNDGTRGAPVAHASPWVTTVGASTHWPREGEIRLGNGRRLKGAMVSDDAVHTAPLVLGSHAAAPGTSRRQAGLCEFGALDADAVEDSIVVCDRGVTARVDKSAAVERAGGAAMVLANTGPGTRDSDLHLVPTVHLGAAAAEDVKDYVRSRGARATATLDPTTPGGVPVPRVARFSSRGTASARGGDLLKPDLTAPGVGVLAAAAPGPLTGPLWDFRSGTSMSAAHVTGLAALVAAAKPAWSPARVKSAMSTTSYRPASGTGPLAHGAGHVDPTRFLDPGLTFDPVPGEWSRFLAGRLPARDLNLPSIAVGDLAGPRTMTRRVTNVSGSRLALHSQVTGLDGVTADVEPDRMTLAPGASRAFTVRLAAGRGAQVGSLTGGALTWADQGHRTRVRIPLAVRPLAASAPEQVTGTVRGGSVRVSGRSGSVRTIAASSTGLVGAEPRPVVLEAGGFDPADPRRDDDTLAADVRVSSDTEVARFETDARDGADLDLFVYRDADLVAWSADDSGEESVTLHGPDPGRYRVYVHTPAAGDEVSAAGRLYTWVVPSRGTAEVDLDPSRLRPEPGSRFELRASWRGLDPGKRWLGAIEYADRRTLLIVK